MKIRPATILDLPVILTIHNREIETGTAIYIDEPQTLAQRAEWYAARTQAGFPVIVVEDENGVAGYGTYGPFRTLPGYRFCVEHSLYITERKRGLGYGRQLLATLIDAATAQRLHTMIAAIDADNAGSIRLHAQFGFTQVGHLPEVGRKFNRWLDLVLMQKMLASS
jgi:phosphinothricin acetyltransferase